MVDVRRGTWMCICLAVFTFRVWGQLYVALGQSSLLPPMHLWYSGLIPYNVLLPIQMILLMLMAIIVANVLTGSTALTPHRQATRRAIRIFAMAYLLIMMVRYPAIMIIKPELRWLGQTIPIFTHWSLAAFLLLLAAGRSCGAEQPNASSLNRHAELT